MASRRNEFLDHGVSDESDQDPGYDSEAGDVGKGARSLAVERKTKRRKLSHSDDEHIERGHAILSRTEEEKEDSEDNNDPTTSTQGPRNPRTSSSTQLEQAYEEDEIEDGPTTTTANGKPDSDKDKDKDRSETSPDPDFKIKSASTAFQQQQQQNETSQKRGKKKDKQKDVKPGVVYLSSLPPYLKPSALRNLLEHRGFSPITRLFLAPSSKSNNSTRGGGSKKNSRQLYSEGWIEFSSKKTAKLCAETLNANIVGGKKGGFYHDDLWNMKYLRGMGWNELMAGVREEKREEEARRDEERRTIAKETSRFIEGVEEGRRLEGMKRKRKAKEDRFGDDNDGSRHRRLGQANEEEQEEDTSTFRHPDGDVKRTWRQYEVKGSSKPSKGQDKETIGQDVQAVLGKIF